jgi:hypothetical protein
MDGVSPDDLDEFLVRMLDVKPTTFRRDEITCIG